MKKIVVIAPHPDDEIIGCGGLILKAKNAGYDLDFVYFMTPEKERLKEINKVKEKLNVKNICLINAGKGRSFVFNKLEKEKLLEVLSQPIDILLIPHINESDQDHSFVNKAVKDCLILRQNNNPLNLILGYEVWSPIKEPTILVNIDEVFEEKLELMQAYKSQIKNHNYINMIRGLSQYRGSLKGKKVNHAEAYLIYYENKGGIFK
ncbi:MAG: PIG-L deacetylase family protein [Candidatus Woesearchaeota archaeon]